MRTTTLVSLVLGVALGACNPEEQPPPPPALTPSTGHLVADTVEGLSYVAGDLTGTTIAGGEYKYYPGEAIEFSIGKARIGQGPAVARMTLLDLAPNLDALDGAVVNRAKFLQSLDNDGDRSNGIQISAAVTALVDRAMDDLGINRLDFYDDAQINQVVFRVFVWSTLEGNENLDLVESDEAQEALKKGLLDENLYRARLSREPLLASARPNILIGRHVIAPVADMAPYPSTRQLVAIWSEEVGHSGARDAYAALSLDSGLTWRNYDLSHSALRSSYTTKDGRELLGDTGPVAAAIVDDRFVAAWSSRFCPNVNPLGLEDDVYGATGPQDAPAVLNAWEAPFACVWAIRGQIQGDGLHLRFPEQITTGVRDASNVRVAGAADVGFTVAWTEDARGEPGRASPGTDAWKTEIGWDDFLVTAGPYEKVPTAKFAGPVRLTDNAVCRFATFNEGGQPKVDWWRRHQLEGDAYCLDVCVAVGRDGYCLTADGAELTGTAAVTDLELAMVHQPKIAVSEAPGVLGHTLFAWEERRGAHLAGSDVRFHAMAPFGADAVVGGSVVNRPDRMGLNPRLATQDVPNGSEHGTRFVIGYQEMDSLYPAENALMMRVAHDGFGPGALGPAVKIGSGDGRAHLGNVALAGDNVAVAYTSGITDGTRDAYVRVSGDGGASFDAGALNVSHVGEGTVDALDARVVWSKGERPMLFATFATRDGDLPGDLYYARSADLGATFDTVPLIDPETGDAVEVFDSLAHAWPDESGARVVVAPDGDDLYAVWLQESKMHSDIWFRPIAY